ncbi:GTPase [Solirubrobacter soli]|uniref:GTPase n=1 Tax=Solirubrobacter soli TaxID=363832 RepID=UPI0003F8BED0|nr:GTPase [Solirubrobacter soli]
MTQAFAETPLDTAVSSAVQQGLETVSKLEEHVAQVSRECVVLARETAARHGDQSGSEVLASLETALRASQADASARFERQRERLRTFNLVLFGRTGAGKSSLIEALSGGDGQPISQGESDWTTDVRDVRWRSCRLFDTPGIGGWGRTVARADLEARAQAAVEDADVVVLCFDTQSQQAGEFRKVADWVAQYGKPVVAVLNSRNARWRFYDRVRRESTRRGMSRSVHEHAGNISDELARIGLVDVPVVAIHTQRAAFGRTVDPYHGPPKQAPVRAQLREQFGADQLVEWSNLPALEALLTAALRDHAAALRLGMLHEQTRGVLGALQERLDEDRVAATALSEQLERGIGDVLRVLGQPKDRALRLRLEELEKLRGGGFGVGAEGEAESRARRRLEAALAGARRTALRRAEQLVEEEFGKRKDIGDERFERVVFVPGRTRVESAVKTVQQEFVGYLNQRLELIVADLRADFDATASAFAGAKGSAGSSRRWAGVGVESVGIGIGVAVMVVAASNPVGWVAGGAAAAATKAFGGRLRKQAARAREQSRSKARANARRAVHERFNGIEAEVCAQLASVVADAFDERLTDQVERASALRHAAAVAERAGALVGRAGTEVPAAGASDHVLADVARRLQRERYPGRPNADRLLWLGEAWCEDPEGLDERLEAPDHDEAPLPPSLRQEHVRERLWAFATARRARPVAGEGAAWLAEARSLLADDEDAMRVLDARAGAQRPRLIVAGDYSAGKSSFIKRLLVEAGTPVPDALAVAAQASTDRVSHFAWGGWDLVDTPGFQSGTTAHAAEAHRALAGASVVLLLLNPNLVVGDPEDLTSVLLGDPAGGRVGKLRRTVFVINRTDELGADPSDDIDAYERLCARKELELTQAIAALVGANPETVLCVAGDPFGMVGDRRDVTAADYAEHRDWDGIAPLRETLLDPQGDLLRHGIDVMVLEGGAAGLGRIVARGREELEAARQGLTQQRRLHLDLEACVAGGEAIAETARDRLAALFVAFVSALYDEIEQAPDATTRNAKIERLEQWSEDDELQQLYAEWTAEVERELQRWQQTTADRVEQRLHSAAFAAAFPALEDAIDLGRLAAEAGPGAKRVAGEGGRLAAGGASKVEREIVLKVAHRLGHKFQPWGAIKLTNKIKFAGKAGGVAFIVWDTGRLLKSLRDEGKAERRAAEIRSQLLSDVRSAANEHFENGPGAELAAVLAPVGAACADVAQRMGTAERAAVALEEKIERTGACVTAALERL